MQRYRSPNFWSGPRTAFIWGNLEMNGSSWVLESAAEFDDGSANQILTERFEEDEQDWRF